MFTMKNEVGYSNLKLSEYTSTLDGPYLNNQSIDSYSSPSPSSINSTDYEQNQVEVKKKSKKSGRRVTWTDNQVTFLEITFQHHKYIDKAKREELSKILNVPESRIRTWFQNRRQKQKKYGPLTNNAIEQQRQPNSSQTSTSPEGNPIDIYSNNNYWLLPHQMANNPYWDSRENYGQFPAPNFASSNNLQRENYYYFKIFPTLKFVNPQQLTTKADQQVQTPYDSNVTSVNESVQDLSYPNGQKQEDVLNFLDEIAHSYV